MRIDRVGNGPFAEVVTIGTMVRVGNIDIDVSAEQQDGQAVLDICEKNGEMVIGTDGASEYVATIVIPGRRYDGEDPLPLDIGSVTITLWPFNEKSGEGQ